MIATPAVADGVVYVGSFDYNVYALDATTGQQIWSFPTESYVESTPTFADGVVYFGSFDNKTYAVDAKQVNKYGVLKRVMICVCSLLRRLQTAWFMLALLMQGRLMELFLH